MLKKTIFVLFLLTILISCNKNKPQDSESETANNNSQTVRERPFLENGGIVLTEILNVRDAPSITGNITRRVYFGEYFRVLDTQGSRRIENGVLDLWYCISRANNEWINALYTALLPFIISNEEKTEFDNSYHSYRTLTIMIDGYRETDSKKELRVNAQGPRARVFIGVLELKEIITFKPLSVNLINNKINILNNYNLELIETGRQFGENENNDDVIFIDYAEDGVWERIVSIHSPEIPLTGIRVGNKRNDIIVQFGNDFSSKVFLDDNYNEIEDIVYYLGYTTERGSETSKISFKLVNGIVYLINSSMIFIK